MPHFISVGFSVPRSKLAIVSWIIRVCEKTPFSHTFLIIYSESLDRKLVYEATSSGVYFVGFSSFIEKNMVVAEKSFEVSDEQKIKILQKCVDKSGKPYGKLQLLGIGIKRFLKLFGINIRNPFANNDAAYICSELVAQVLNGVIDFSDVDLDLVGLSDIYEKVMGAKESPTP